jgi:hypothetical protein
VRSNQAGTDGSEGQPQHQQHSTKALWQTLGDVLMALIGNMLGALRGSSLGLPQLLQQLVGR